MGGKWGVGGTDEVKETPPAASAGFPGREWASLVHEEVNFS